ncbi:hypothetical protein BLOT_015867 [Blomia tropicalis]|nr:hypothetical protein BLOT_015867 [Blomia tropicalis]
MEDGTIKDDDSFYTKFKKIYESNRNSILTILSVLVGLICGIIIRTLFWPDGNINPYLLRYASLPGTIYIRAFLMLVVPLLVTSVATSLLHSEMNEPNSDSEDVQLVTNEEIDPKKLLSLSLMFFVCFSLFASLLGISLMTIVKPGLNQSDMNYTIVNIDNCSIDELVEIKRKRMEKNNYHMDSFVNIIMNIFPDNLLQPMFATTYTQTQIVWPKENMSQILEANFKARWKHQTTNSFKPNMIGICAMSFALGLLLKSLGVEKTRTIRLLLKETESIVSQSFQVLLNFMPIGMFLWMFAEGLRMQSISNVAIQLIYFYGLIAFSFIILWFVFYPLVLFIITGENMFQLYRMIMPAILVAIGSTSSAITLPVTMQCMVERAQVSKTIARSILPLGMTIHMNGVSLYYPMCAIFVAQMKHIEVDPIQLIVLGLFALAMSMGLPGAPAGGATLINHIAFASVIGIDNPQNIIAFILAFEWICERIRTATNIVGDCVVAKCIEQIVQPKRGLRKNSKTITTHF